MTDLARRKLIDTVMDLYVAWRERSAAVDAAYRRFRDGPPSERAIAHAAYLAALDQEELAAIDYRRSLERAIAVCREEDRVAI
jgi:hypothetical protein